MPIKGKPKWWLPLYTLTNTSAHATKHIRPVYSEIRAYIKTQITTMACEKDIYISGKNVSCQKFAMTKSTSITRLLYQDKFVAAVEDFCEVGDQL